MNNSHFLHIFIILLIYEYVIIVSYLLPSFRAYSSISSLGSTLEVLYSLSDKDKIFVDGWSEIVRPRP
jgi:hypothetical protein